MIYLKMHTAMQATWVLLRNVWFARKMWKIILNSARPLWEQRGCCQSKHVFLKQNILKTLGRPTELSGLTNVLGKAQDNLQKMLTFEKS